MKNEIVGENSKSWETIRGFPKILPRFGFLPRFSHDLEIEIVGEYHGENDEILSILISYTISPTIPTIFLYTFIQGRENKVKFIILYRVVGKRRENRGNVGDAKNAPIRRRPQPTFFTRRLICVTQCKTYNFDPRNCNGCAARARARARADAFLTVRLPSATLAMLDRAALRDGRSRSDFAVRTIQRRLADMVTAGELPTIGGLPA